MIVRHRLKRLLSNQTLALFRRIRAYLCVLNRLTGLLKRALRGHNTVLIDTLNRIIKLNLNLLGGHTNLLANRLDSIFLSYRRLDLFINFPSRVHNTTLNKYSSNINLYLYKFRTTLNFTRRYKNTFRLRQRRLFRFDGLTNRLITVRFSHTKQRRTNFNLVRRKFGPVSSIVRHNRFYTTLIFHQINLRNFARVKRYTRVRYNYLNQNQYKDQHL